MGERGPELVNLPRGSRVHSAADTEQMMGGVNIPISGNTFVIREEADVDRIGRAIARQVRDELGGGGLSGSLAGAT